VHDAAHSNGVFICVNMRRRVSVRAHEAGQRRGKQINAMLTARLMFSLHRTPKVYAAVQSASMPSFEDCMRRADELALQVVKRWANLASADETSAFTDEFTCLFEKAVRYEIASALRTIAASQTF
jgi:hypothetical protein